MFDYKRETKETKDSVAQTQQPLTPEIKKRFIKAIESDDFETIKQLVTSGIDINAQLKVGGTALSIATHNKTSYIFKCLLSLNPNLHEDLCQEIALHSPWETPQKAEILTLLQDKGATPLDQLLIDATLGNLDNIQKSIKEKKNVIDLIHYAAQNGKVNIIEWVLTQDNITNKDISNFFEMVVECGQLNTVQWFLEQYPDLLFKATRNNENIVFRASFESKIWVVEFLLSKLPPEQKNAYLHQKNSYSAHTPLLEAADRGNLEAMKALIKHGANIDDKDRNGDTALLLAVRNGDLEVVKCILTAYPAKIHEKDAMGMTPLHHAAKHNRLQVLQYLVAEAEKDPSFSMWKRSDAKLTLTDINQGRTPLHWAAEADALDVVKWLVTQYPQDIDSVDNNGATPLLEIALSLRHIEIIRYLIANGASLHYKNQGENALAIAARSRDADTLVPILISEFGADPNQFHPGYTDRAREKQAEYLRLYRNYFIKQKNEIYKLSLENSLETEVIPDLRQIMFGYLDGTEMTQEEIDNFKIEMGIATEKLLAPLKAHIEDAQKPQHKALAQQLMREISVQYPRNNPLTVRRAVIAFLEIHKETIKGSEFAGILNNMLEETDYLKESTKKQTPAGAKALPQMEKTDQQNALPFSALANNVGWFGGGASVINPPATHQTTLTAQPPVESDKGKATSESAVPK